MITVILLSVALISLIVFIIVNVHIGFKNKEKEFKNNIYCSKVNNVNNVSKKLPKNYYKMNCGNIVKNTENRFYLNEKIY